MALDLKAIREALEKATIRGTVETGQRVRAQNIDVEDNVGMRMIRDALSTPCGFFFHDEEAEAVALLINHAPALLSAAEEQDLPYGWTADQVRSVLRALHIECVAPGDNAWRVVLETFEAARDSVRPREMNESQQRMLATRDRLHEEEGHAWEDERDGLRGERDGVKRVAVQLGTMLQAERDHCYGPEPKGGKHGAAWSEALEQMPDEWSETVDRWRKELDNG